MSLIEETFEVYVQMRGGGKDPNAALSALRSRIETLKTGEQAELVRRVKEWETQRSARLHHGADLKAMRAEPSKAPLHTGSNCPRCGKLNPVGELLCANCGTFLGGESSPHETVRLADPDAATLRTDYFGPDSKLVLTVTEDSRTYSIQPQHYKHETVIGRSEGSTMKPDIDLRDHRAGERGVSRLHVALQYNAKHNLLSVSDMKSANGTFINGQRLYPQEVRVLRSGDELRLGRLVMRVDFLHPRGEQR